MSAMIPSIFGEQKDGAFTKIREQRLFKTEKGDALEGAP